MFEFLDSFDNWFVFKYNNELVEIGSVLYYASVFSNEINEWEL
jgi:hypothetical protein